MVALRNLVGRFSYSFPYAGPVDPTADQSHDPAQHNRETGEHIIGPDTEAQPNPPPEPQMEFGTINQADLAWKPGEP